MVWTLHVAQGGAGGGFFPFFRASAMRPEVTALCNINALEVISCCCDKLRRQGPSAAVLWGGGVVIRPSQCDALGL